jgi:hypothetical protein
MYKSIRNLSACVEKRGELGWMFGCSLGGERGEVGWGRRRRNRGRECRESQHILAFTDGITDGNFSSVYSSVIPPVEVSRR